MLTKGQRVQTPLGVGTVVGFEVFDGKGWPLPPVEIDPNNTFRVLIHLDQPENWIGASLEHPDPYIFRSQLSELKED